LGVSVTNGNPSALAALMNDERARWGKVIKTAGISAN
jgi:hypothetical protein